MNDIGELVKPDCNKASLVNLPYSFKLSSSLNVSLNSLNPYIVKFWSNTLLSLLSNIRLIGAPFLPPCLSF